MSSFQFVSLKNSIDVNIKTCNFLVQMEVEVKTKSEN